MGHIVINRLGLATHISINDMGHGIQLALLCDLLYNKGIDWQTTRCSYRLYDVINLIQQAAWCNPSPTHLLVILSVAEYYM